MIFTNNNVDRLAQYLYHRAVKAAPQPRPWDALPPAARRQWDEEARELLAAAGGKEGETNA